VLKDRDWARTQQIFSSHFDLRNAAPTGVKVMKSIQSETIGGQVAKIVVRTLACSLLLATPVFSQLRAVNAVPAGAVTFARVPAPNGVKVLARVPLNGQPVTRLYTQFEYGRTYLYIEPGQTQLTTVDVTKKQNPKVVDHSPAKAQPTRYQELAEGGTIEVSSPWQVNPGFDSVGKRGVFSVLASTDPNDAPPLQAFGRQSVNLADRDRHLIFFASPVQLLIVEDDRWKGMDYEIN
jgi:hypothetical protein